MTSTKVGVFGLNGRMGRSVCGAIREAPDLILAAGVGSGDSRGPLAEASVLVDFTRPDAVMDNIQWGISRGLHLVVGTSGIDEDRLATIRTWLASAPEVGVIVVPNFCISAVLAMRFAAQAARHFSEIEIVDLAHKDKAEAPSATALRTAQMIQSARDLTAAPPGMHSIRLEGLAFHQKVMMSRLGEILTIRFDTTDRAAYMSGVLLAIRAVGSRPGLTNGLEPLLALD